MSVAVEDQKQPEWELPEGWRYWEGDPPKEGERVVRRTIADMETNFSSEHLMQWHLVQASMRFDGGFRYMWQPLEDYMSDPEERRSRSGPLE